MGRKIPGRKHKGVRDPEKQREIRLNSLKDKINAPPTNPDEQHIPKSLTRLIELKDKTKKGEFNRKNKKLQPRVAKKPLPGKPEKPVPVFKQGRKESEKQFLYRVNQVCKSVIKEAAFEKKYGVDVKRNPETGKVEGVVKRKKDEIDALMGKARKPKDKSKKKKKEPTEPKLTKYQKRREKLKAKKQSRLLSNTDEFEKYRDSVKFGEVAHAPPSLVAPRKVEPSKSAPRPGTKDLHLKSLLNGNKPNTDNLRKTTNKVINRKGKRKDLPHALRRQLDQQQREIVQAYKELKEKRAKQ